MNGICFLEPHAALATCNLEGRIAVWRMGPAPDPRKDFSDLEEQDQDQGLYPWSSATGLTLFFVRNESTLEPLALRPLVIDTSSLSVSLRPCLSKLLHLFVFVSVNGGGGGYGDAAAIERADNKRRKRTTRRMAPSSEWRCVALFFNNTAAPTVSSCAGTAGANSSQGVRVPAAVNSLAWSSLEERLFTADTVGFVKVKINIRTFVPRPLLFYVSQKKMATF